MAHVFPSEGWIKAYKEAIDTIEAYKAAGKTWTHGVVVLVCNADPSIGLDEDVGIWLDLHMGTCREALLVDKAKAYTAPFCIAGEYGRWKQVIHKKLDPIKGMMQGKLKLKGNLPIIVRHVRASQELVECATKVDTKFLDE